MKIILYLAVIAYLFSEFIFGSYELEKLDRRESTSYLAAAAGHAAVAAVVNFLLLVYWQVCCCFRSFPNVLTCWFSIRGI